MQPPERNCACRKTGRAAKSRSREAAVSRCKGPLACSHITGEESEIPKAQRGAVVRELLG